MLIYNSKQNLHGADDVRGAGSPATRGAGTAPVSLIGPAAAMGAVSSIQTMSNVDLLLPQPDGNKVLNAPEPAIAQKSQSAAKLYASLMTPQAQKAVPAVALEKYLSMLEPVLAADKQKRKQNLDSFLARLRIWPLLNQIFWAATDELDPFIGGKRVRIELVKELVAKAKSMLPPDMGKDDQPRKQLDAIVGQVEAIKQAEVNLMKAQLGKGKSWLLSETRVLASLLGPASSDYIFWVGPVAVNPRVAKVTVKKDKDGKEIGKTLEYPIPDLYRSPYVDEVFQETLPLAFTDWKVGEKMPPQDKRAIPPAGAFSVPTPLPETTNRFSPAFVAQLPGLADYLPYSDY